MGQGVVAIVDSGVSEELVDKHPENIVGVVNCVENVSRYDEDGHGTFIAQQYLHLQPTV